MIAGPLVEASAGFEASQIRLARLMHWELEAEFLAEEVSLEDRRLIRGEDRFQGYIETPEALPRLP